MAQGEQGMSRGRLIAAVAISAIPFKAVRTQLYRWTFGYRIVGSEIGFGTVIVVAHASLDNCKIGRFNRFLGPMRISIGAGSEIENHNVFDCGAWATREHSTVPYARELSIGRRTRITSHHFFDVVGRCVLGDDSWVAGRDSQFWTHGVGVTERDVSIGRGTYIGSAVRFAPGSSVADNVIVGLGSVVTKRIDTCNAIVAGMPAQVISEGRGWTSIPES